MSSRLKKLSSPDDRPSTGGETHLTRVTATMPDGSVMVLAPGSNGDRNVLAKLCNTINLIGVGDTVVAFFDYDHAIVLGVVGVAGQSCSQALTVDGNRLVVRGRDEIEFSCGRASIRLQADGKIVIDGETIISRALRTNCIEGAAVKIN